MVRDGDELVMRVDGESRLGKGRMHPMVSTQDLGWKRGLSGAPPAAMKASHPTNAHFNPHQPSLDLRRSLESISHVMTLHHHSVLPYSLQVS